VPHPESPDLQADQQEDRPDEWRQPLQGKGRTERIGTTENRDARQVTDAAEWNHDEEEPAKPGPVSMQASEGRRNEERELEPADTLAALSALAETNGYQIV
jgi:hypothetical protein